MDGDLVAPVKVNQPVYAATVALDRPNVDVRGRKVPLQPDMSLHADIILERRSIMDWIVGPLRHIGLE
jgi:membrane fusion protein